MKDMNAMYAGYSIERIFAATQEYALVSEENTEASSPSDVRGVEFGWDWRPSGTRKFEVIIDLSIAPSKAIPERAKVRVVGVFQAVGESPSICFRDFARNNASAILFPYAREIVSAMTGRGIYGAYHVAPINILGLLKDVPFESTTGFESLKDDSAARENFGLNLYEVSGERPIESP